MAKLTKHERKARIVERRAKRKETWQKHTVNIKGIKNQFLGSVLIPPLVTLILLRIYRIVVFLVMNGTLSLGGSKSYVLLPTGATFASLLTAVAFKNKWDGPKILIMALLLVMYLHDIFFIKNVGSLVTRPFLETFLGMIFGVFVGVLWYFLFLKKGEMKSK